MRPTHEVCHKLRQTDVSSEYVRVFQSEWDDTVVRQQFRRASDPHPIEAPAYRHGDFGTYLRQGDLWRAFCRADGYHTQAMLDVFDPVEIVLCCRDPERAWRRITRQADQFGCGEVVPDHIREEYLAE